MDEGYVDNLWNLLKNELQHIQKTKKCNSLQRFEELYHSGYTMVLHRHGARLYNGVKDLVTVHVQTEVRLPTLLSKIKNRGSTKQSSVHFLIDSTRSSFIPQRHRFPSEIERNLDRSQSFHDRDSGHFGLHGQGLRPAEQC